ncbi:hypothetical protein EN742_05910 [Mesorhizobium sp. M4A.F.Ca.ET.020.02.1.1]|uniref:hypothetical protein n=1 Tax=unclassified Mesorhizobium TaxID=325217 RepID=UPI000FD2FE33|nr:MULTISPECIES: hypothetical protein [unclassified Mesorhizobium]RVD43113.1 hypothetical protein EN742_05910 [Mesorhizobium sp. M4A.F.Ca.ET.020.02.1.1]RWC20882.1 MAG: hypothetical protein EOS53_07980 [Mesorhizobium sp.]
MTTVAQAYLHTSKNGTDAELAEWGLRAEALAYEIASSVFPMEVELEIVFQVGSLISRSLVKKIGAGLLAAYGGIAIYPDFKNGLLEAIADARTFSGAFNERFMSEAGIKAKDIVARQRRIETPGRINRALDRLENLERNTSADRGLRYHQELHDAVTQLQWGLSDLEHSDRQQAVQLIVEYHEPRLPEPLLPQLMRPVAWRREDEEFGLVESAAARPDIKFLAKLRTDEPLRSQHLLEDKKTERGKLKH